MGKSKKGKGGKLGAPDHFTGFKKEFLVSHAMLYQQCLDSKSVPAFYDKVTLDFIAKYGEEELFNKEPAEDPPNPELFGDDNDDNNDTSPSKEEAAESAILFKKLRTASCKQLNIPHYILNFFSRNLDSGIGGSINVPRL